MLTLALGIGANTLIFSAVDAVLLRDVQVAHPNRLSDVFTSSGDRLFGNSSYPDYFDLRDSGVFASLARPYLAGRRARRRARAGGR